MDELYEILTDCCPNVDFHTDQPLIDDGFIESLDIVMIVGELSDRYDIEIGVDDLTPENFNSVEAIYAMIRRLQEEL